MNSDTTLQMLTSPKEAAHAIEKIINSGNWAVLYTDLSELQDFIPYFPRDWDKDIEEDVTRLIIDIKEGINDPFDLVCSLSHENFLIITSRQSLPMWEKELHKEFSNLMEEKLPVTMLNEQNIVLMADEIFPVPELIYGVVTDADGTFSTPGEVYRTAVKRKERNERHILLLTLHSRLFTTSGLKEELHVLTAHPGFYSLVKRFTTIAASHLFEIRNNLNTLKAQTMFATHNIAENTKAMNRETTAKDGPGNIPEKIPFSLQHMEYIIESLLEIPFHGTGLLEKTDIHSLVTEQIQFLAYSINHPVTFGEIEQTIPVYTEPRQIITALFALLSLAKLQVKKNDPLHIDCGISEKTGFIEIKGNFQVDMSALFSDSTGEFNTNMYWPFLYIFKKIISRLYGSIEIDKNTIFIFLPMYEYQNKSFLSSLRKQIKKAGIEQAELKARIRAETDAAIDTEYITEIIKPAIPLVKGLLTAFREYEEIITPFTLSKENSGAYWETIRTGSTYCSLLLQDLLSLDTEGIFTAEGTLRTSSPVTPLTKPAPGKTHVSQTFDLVKQVLTYRFAGNVNQEFLITHRLPMICGEKTALSRVIINLIITSLSKPAYASPREPYFIISAEEKASHVIITIKDNGAGISESFVEHITDQTPLLQGEIAEGTEFYAIQSTLRSMDAQIEFDIHPGTGTTTRIFVNKWKDQ